MFDKENDNKIVGAKEKILKAQKFNPKFAVKSSKEGKAKSPVIPLVIIAGISVIFALLLTEGPFKAGINIHTGNSQFDRLFFGPGTPSLTGTPDTDYGIAVFLRGMLIFLLGGVLPLFTYVWEKFLDKSMNVYLSFWGVSVSIGLVYYLVKDSLTPLLKEVIGIIF